jgi:glycosyltransferase involved in cell wall biosynthesis
VLFDLRAAFDRHYGIPQETRLSFPLLSDLDGLDVAGLIHHPALSLARGRRRHRLSKPTATPAQDIETMSRLVATATPRGGRFGPLRDRLAFVANFLLLQSRSMLGISVPLDHFDGAEFGDFLWQSLFSLALPPSEFERCRTSAYAALSPSWQAMHATALVPWPRRYVKIDTSEYDVVLVQTPWPGIVRPRTQLVVRFHDMVPMFLPHTLKRPRLSQFFQLSTLKANAKAAAFACVSEASRLKLLQVFPELERRSFVVHDCIAPEYVPSSPAREIAASIVLARIDASSEPQWGSPARRQWFYDTHLVPQDFRYILMVSSLEPRKNHVGLIAAWEALRLKAKSAPALVLVGSPGWQSERVYRAMRTWQERGKLFHLSGVPPREMSVLYANAEAVVCPSVHEGFDLPAVEALCCGSAVAASDIASHREMLGDAVAYFDPYSTAGMSETLAHVLAEDTQKVLRQKAVKRAAHFDISHTRCQWQEVFEYCRGQREQKAAG